MELAGVACLSVGGEEHVHGGVRDAVELVGGRERVRAAEHDLVHRQVHDEPGELIGGQGRVGQALQEPAVGQAPYRLAQDHQGAVETAVAAFELAEATPTSTGTLIATYRPAR